MRFLPTAAGTLSAALLVSTLVGPATAAPREEAVSTATATVCGLRLGSVTASGDHRLQQISASSPPTVTRTIDGPKNLFPDDQWRLAGSVGWEPAVAAGEHRYGLVTIGHTLYSFGYQTSGDLLEVQPGTFGQTAVGGGWTPAMSYFDQSAYYYGTSVRTNVYALWSGWIWRWGAGWRGVKIFKGFEAVKAMALISQTRTYDTFLATTKGGALYTIRTPTSGTAVPVVKPVRTRTWQGFETLIAERCGRQSTLLLGIDKDTGSGYLYAVSHANGTATIIQSLGKVPANFTDPAYFRFWLNTLDSSGALFGE